MIDDDTRLPACPPYVGHRVHEEIFEFWPSDLEEVFIEAGIPRRLPPRNSECSNAGMMEGNPPAITSPMRSSTYVMRLARGDRQPIALAATADADAHTLYWFIDNAYIGHSRPDDPVYWQPPSAGDFRVRAVDDLGRSDERPLSVRLEQ